MKMGEKQEGGGGLKKMGGGKEEKFFKRSFSKRLVDLIK